MSAVREKAAAWFRGALRRLALARLHGQMAALCQVEADEIEARYAWPPRGPLTPEEREQVDHLRDLGDRAFAEVERLSPIEGTRGAFYDFAFG